jgi:hypothetical protein
MASNISTVNINTNFPVQGKDNPSQGFRDNFGYITQALNIAANEITNLQSFPAGISIASTITSGIVRIGSGINVTNNGVISVSPGNYTLTTATSNSLGGVRVGSGLSITGNGTLSATYVYNLPRATANVLGGVKIGSGISVDAEGMISVPPGNYILTTATSNSLGGVKIGTGISITADGTISAAGGGGLGLTSRKTVSTTTSVLSPGSTATTFIVGEKGYILYKITASTSSWIRLYSSNAARSADSTRSINTDPLPSSGVIAEFITTSTAPILVSPGVFGFNDETSPTTSIPISVTNQSNSTVAVTVSLVIVQLEV